MKKTISLKISKLMVLLSWLIILIIKRHLLRLCLKNIAEIYNIALYNKFSLYLKYYSACD
jgi:hypothetical protein